MISVVRSPKKRPYVYTIVLVVLVSWLSLVISTTCSTLMASAMKALPEHTAGCPDTNMPGHGDGGKFKQDCSLKLCLESPSGISLDLDRLPKPDLPVLVLLVIGIIYNLRFPPSFPQSISKKTDHPPGRQIPIIYRFCTLLN